MNNLYLQEQMARSRREEAVAHAEHARFMQTNGLDLMSVLRRAAAELLARVRLFQPSAPDLHLVSRAQLDRRMDRAA